MKKLLVCTTLIAAWLTSIVYVYGLGGLAGMYAPELVDDSTSRSLPLATFLLQFSGQGPICSDDPRGCGNKDTTDKKEVSCDIFSTGNTNSRNAVLFTFGQSNSANAARDRYVAGPDVINFNFHDGKCYRAEDPLLGPDGSGGSVWGALADKLVSNGKYDNVLVAPFGIGGTDISRWAPNGDLHVRVEAVSEQLHRLKIKPTHVLWHQGEADSVPEATTTKQSYIEHFKALAGALKTYGIDAPIYPAVATICGNKGSDAIRSAQQELPIIIEGVFPGPDTDAITGERNRHDSCHFTHIGIQEHAELWLRAVTIGKHVQVDVDLL